MDEEKQREIASKGGRSVAAEKRSFSRDRDLAADAGRKGGAPAATAADANPAGHAEFRMPIIENPL